LYRSVEWKVPASLVYPLLTYHRLKSEKGFQKRDFPESYQESILYDFPDLPKDIVFDLSRLRLSELLYIKPSGRNSELVYSRESENVPLSPIVSYFCDRAVELDASCIVIADYERYFAFDEERSWEYLINFLNGGVRTIVIMTDNVLTSGILRIVQGKEIGGLDPRIQINQDLARSSIMQNANALLCIYPDRSKKKLKSGNRLEIDAIEHWRNWADNLFSSYKLEAVVSSVVLYGEDTKNFRDTTNKHLKRILSMPFAVKKYTTMTPYILELNNKTETTTGTEIYGFEKNDVDQWNPVKIKKISKKELSDTTWDCFFEQSLALNTITHDISLNEIIDANMIIRGKNITKKNDNPTGLVLGQLSKLSSDKNIIEVNVRSLQDGRLCFEGGKIDIFDGPLHKNKAYILEEGDILVACKGTQLKSALFPVRGDHFPELIPDVSCIFDPASDSSRWRWINVYIPIDTYSTIINNQIHLLATSNLLIIRLSRKWVSETYNNDPKREQEVFSFFTRYVALVMRDEEYGVGQLKRLQTGGEQIINLNPEKLLGFKIPQINYEYIVSFVQNVEESYYVLEKTKFNHENNLKEYFNNILR